MATAASILANLKATDPTNIGVVTLVTQDPIYERLIAAWPSTKRRLKVDADPNEVCPPDTPLEFHLLWVWSRIQPEPEPVWATVAGLPLAPHVIRAMHTLRDHAAVFPDGTLSQWIEQYLTKLAARLGVKATEEATT